MRPFSRIIAVSLSVIFCIPSIAYAGYEEDLAAIKTNLGEKAISACHDNLTAGFDLEITEFMKFLETNFQNKGSNSSLTNIAIARYADYKISLENLFNSLQIQPVNINTSNTYISDFNAWGNCQTLMQDYLALAKEKMMEKIKVSANQKKTTVMMEKYNDINVKLRDLNLEIAKLYGAFMTFKDKLPFFNQNCVTS